jgi:hypothetical protein
MAEDGEKDEIIDELSEALGIDLRNPSLTDRLLFMLYKLAIDTGGKVRGFKPEFLPNDRVFVIWIGEPPGGVYGHDNEPELVYSCFTKDGKMLWSEGVDRITKEKAREKCLQS